MRTVVDYDVDRLGVEERQRSELTSTNRPIGLAMTFDVAFVRLMGQALRRNPRMGEGFGRIQGFGGETTIANQRIGNTPTIFWRLLRRGHTRSHPELGS